MPRMLATASHFQILQAFSNSVNYGGWGNLDISARITFRIPPLKCVILSYSQDLLHPWLYQEVLYFSLQINGPSMAGFLLDYHSGQ